MTKPLTGLCDFCGKITDIKFKVEKYPNKLEETYFECEFCHFHFTCFVTDAWVRKKQKEIKNLRTSLGITTEQLEEKQEKINSRMKLLKQQIAKKKSI
ncbi:FlxA-like family protein [Paucisalibacillus globulus]|uniref:FlxA-like family protein n=1 Tax=Paucisalibacillus globulus TaxID=351095 RepID=UPI000BB6AE8C|nr:FlxA-like family protein [Paucisalibacillus globulus]